jgi:hypothetical protein
MKTTTRHYGFAVWFCDVLVTPITEVDCSAFSSKEVPRNISKYSERFKQHLAYSSSAHNTFYEHFAMSTEILWLIIHSNNGFDLK